MLEKTNETETRLEGAMSGGKLLERRLEGRLSLSLSFPKREREQLPPRPGLRAADVTLTNSILSRDDLKVWLGLETAVGKVTSGLGASLAFGNVFLFFFLLFTHRTMTRLQGEVNLWSDV